ncbi:MAG: GGDEF domain-containing protein [Planctomycetes bacterium]|nr:GGDEF domain-containing protein [Planctomycetota bacterium]
MVTIVFALAAANLGLGFALAMALDRLAVWSIPGSEGGVGAGGRGDGARSEGEGDERATVRSDDWSQKLKLAEVDPKSAVERLLWIVKLETSSHREHLIGLDRAFFDPISPQLIAKELRQRLEAFHLLLESWIAEADAEREQPSPTRDALEELLLDQAFQLKSCADGLADAGRDEVARQLATAMALINGLRDRADEILCQLLTQQDRLHTIADRYRTYGERTTLTRLGLASLFDEWWSEDEEHVRLVSLVMLDLDRFEPFTRRVGAARGDVALLRFGDMLHDLLRKDRGFDRVARFSGQRFVMFLGDTSSKNASKGAERIRQTIEATSFSMGEETSEVTASLAVVEVGKSEGPDDFIVRLESTLSDCKKAGGNCSQLNSGDESVRIELPQYQVNVHVIELDEEVLQVC